MVDCLPLPRCVDQIALTIAASAPSAVGRTPTTSVAVGVVATHPYTTIAPMNGTCSSSVGVDEYNKDGIIFDVRRVQAKRKTILAMGKTVTGAPNVTKRVQMGLGFARLLNSLSSTPLALVEILDDNVQQSEGVLGASEQPNVFVQVMSEVPPNSSLIKGSGSVEHGSTPPSVGIGEGSFGPPTFFPA